MTDKTREALAYLISMLEGTGDINDGLAYAGLFDPNHRPHQHYQVCRDCQNERGEPHLLDCEYMRAIEEVKSWMCVR